MSLLSWLPWQTHPGASCDRRERNSAIAAIASCFVLALGLVIAAILFAAPADPPGDDAAGTAGGGYGTGSGSGFGAGVGSGSALAGDGPGAGTSGDLHGAVGETADSAPRGQRTGTLASANAVEGESLVSGESKELPKFGFTLPNINDPIDPPQTATAVGKKDGKDGAGRAGAGGGGGAQFMGIRTDAKSIVYIVDFSSSMRNEDGRESLLKRELAQSIQSLRDGCKFTVILFGISPENGAKLVESPNKSGTVYTNAVPMPPRGEWLAATASNRDSTIRWVTQHESDPAGGSGTWDSMRIALQMNPEVIFLLTDGEFDSSDLAMLRDEITAGNKESLTQINTIAFASENDVQSLQTIAQENNGTYRRVTITP